MKSKILIIVLLQMFFHGIAQEIPVIKIGKEKISVKKIKVEATVIGDIVFTTYDMQFYNPNNRVLEGELVFPLGENQSVNRFALDINGNLREAVVIEKEKARVAFESTVRRQIDPALLEKTKGNTYKARIYPIPAKGYKRVVIGVQQKLLLNNDSYYLKLPFNFKDKLEDFSVSIEVLNQKNKPEVVKGMISKFEYNSKKDAYYAFLNRKKIKVIQPVLVKIPLNTSGKKVLATDRYFYVSKKLNISINKTNLEKNITIFWDASLSQKSKKVTAELSLLDLYFRKILEANVQLVVFNTDVRSNKKFVIKNGNWDQLKKELNSVVYDGGSAFDILQFQKNTSKANLLFTDGMNTLDDFKVDFDKKTYVINSAISANHIILKDKALRSGGDYINLAQLSIKKAFEKLSNEKLQFLGTDLDAVNVTVYPKRGSEISDNFFIVGKGNVIGKTFKVFVGQGDKVLETITVSIPQISIKVNQLPKIWAQQKLNDLIRDKENNRTEIIRLSKQYQIISPFTSMLILDRVEDYVEHEIVPPSELLDEYNRLMSQKVNNKKQRLADLQRDLYATYEDFFNWYKKDFSVIKRKLSKEKLYKIDSTGEPMPNVIIEQEFTDEDEAVEVESIEEAEEYEEIVEPEDIVLRQSSVVRENLNAFNIDKKTELSALTSKRRSDNEQSRVKYAYVVDGELIDGTPNTKSLQIVNTYRLTAQQGWAIFGEKASQGIIVINTKKGSINSKERIEQFEQLVRNKTELKGWNPKTPYLDALHKTTNLKEAYTLYVKLRETYGNSPSFYIDVADFFKSRNDNVKAIQILTNVAEIDVDNYELLKALAYKFEAYELHEYAVFIYKEILKLRPEDIQSYRDLALAYECVDEYQKSIDILYQIVNGELLEKDESRRFSGIEAIALVEFNRMLQLYGEKLETQHFESRFITPIKTNIRVLIDWNHNDTDIDLWVIDPNGEKCFYSHKKTKIGGLMSQDMTRGFGPEQFLLKKGLEGKYQLKVKYYSSSQQKISGPTFLKLTTFKYYGTKNEIKKTQLIRLKEVDEVLDLGNFFFNLRS